MIYIELLNMRYGFCIRQGLLVNIVVFAFCMHNLSSRTIGHATSIALEQVAMLCLAKPTGMSDVEQLRHVSHPISPMEKIPFWCFLPIMTQRGCLGTFTPLTSLHSPRHLLAYPLMLPPLLHTPLQSGHRCIFQHGMPMLNSQLVLCCKHTVLRGWFVLFLSSYNGRSGRTRLSPCRIIHAYVHYPPQPKA